MQRKTILLIIASILLVILIGILLLNNSAKVTPTVTAPAIQNTQVPSIIPISITDEPFTLEYYSGTKPVIAGSSAIAVAAREFVNASIQEYNANAIKEVPDRQKEFGAEAPAAAYTIDMHAKEVHGANTESILIDSYLYMGGANGMSTYKAFTMSKATGKLLTLQSVVPKEKQAAFVALVKKELLALQSGGVFEEEISKLTIQSLDDWSTDQNGALTLYFDKYEVGAGALGAVAVPISAAKIASYVQLP